MTETGAESFEAEAFEAPVRAATLSFLAAALRG